MMHQNRCITTKYFDSALPDPSGRRDIVQDVVQNKVHHMPGLGIRDHQRVILHQERVSPIISQEFKKNKLPQAIQFDPQKTELLILSPLNHLKEIKSDYAKIQYYLLIQSKRNYRCYRRKIRTSKI